MREKISFVARDRGILAYGRAIYGTRGALFCGVALSVKQTDHCSALTPRDWSISSNPQASTLDAESADQTMYAGWGVLQVNRAMQQYYGPMYGDPQTSMQAMANIIVRSKFGDSSGVQYTSAPRPFLKYFGIRSFASQRAQGVVFYHDYPVADPEQLH